MNSRESLSRTFLQPALTGTRWNRPVDIIIEIMSRSRRVIERHRFAGNAVTIGRAYDNDLIIADPHVDEHHARLTDLGIYGWQVQDLESKNGIFTRRNQRIESSGVVQSGDEIVLGKTHLRILDRRHRVPGALSLNPIENILQPLGRLHNAALIIVLVLLISALDSYLGLYVDFEFRHIFADVFGLALVGAGWAVLWALAGRLIRHDARFLIQFVIVMMFLAVEVVFSNLLDLLAFNDSNDLSLLFGATGHFFLLGGLLWLNMYIALNQSDQKRLLTSFGFSASAVFMVMIYYLLYVPDFSPVPDYNYYLKPPSVQWVDGVSVDEYLQDAGQMFEDMTVNPE